MNALDLARWQFGITTIYHFLFMPLSIGLSLLIAILQTAWFRTGSAFSCMLFPLEQLPAMQREQQEEGRDDQRDGRDEDHHDGDEDRMRRRSAGERQAGAGQQRGVLGHAPAEHDGRHAQHR